MSNFIQPDTSHDRQKFMYRYNMRNSEVKKKNLIFATVLLLSLFASETTLTAALQENESNQQALEKAYSNPTDYLVVSNSEFEFRGKNAYEVFHFDDLTKPVATLFGISGDSMRVTGKSDFFINKYLPTFERGLTEGFPSVYQGTGLDNEPVIIQGREGYFLGSDLVHCVKVKDGDIWLGRIDWGKGKLIEKQISSTGSFGGTRPFLKSGKYFYLGHPDSTFTKVDSDTGEFEQVKLAEANAERFFSPDMRAIVSIANKEITIVDLQTGDKRQLPNTINYKHPTNPNAATEQPFELFEVGYMRQKMAWASSRTMVYPSHGGLSILNLDTATSDFLPLGENHSEFSQRYYHSNQRRAEIELSQVGETLIAKVSNQSSGQSITKWVVVDIANKVVTKLVTNPQRPTWLTKNRFFDEIYDRQTKKRSIRYEQISPKLSVELHDNNKFHKYGQPFFHDSINERFYYNRGSVNGEEWSVCDLKTGKNNRLEQFDKFHKHVGGLPELFDLGFTTKPDKKIVSIFKTSADTKKATTDGPAKPTFANTSKALAFDFCVSYDLQKLNERARRDERNIEEMKVLTPVFANIAKQFLAKRITRKKARLQKHQMELSALSPQQRSTVENKFQNSETYSDSQLSNLEYVELKLEVWKALRQSNLSPNPKQYLGIPADVVAGVGQSLDDLRKLHDSGKQVEFVGHLFGQILTSADVERAKTDRRFNLPRRLRDVLNNEETIAQLRLSLDQVDFSKATYSKSDSTLKTGRMLNFRLHNGKWILFKQSGR